MTENSPRCVVFSDIRGDFRLLVTLLTQITRVATWEKDEWSWNTENTTVVCLGNFTDRFAERGFNRLVLSTATAISDQEKILNAFTSLIQSAKSGNNLVVLMGDHELANLMNWSTYKIFQMAQPDNPSDQALHDQFVDEQLRPFCAGQGILAGWGDEGMMVYFSRGSIEKKWLMKNKFRSVTDVNQTWQKAVRSGHLRRFAEPNSPLFSSLEASLWRDNDEDYVVPWLGPDIKPKFIQSVFPIQNLAEESLDFRLRPPFCDKQKPDAVDVWADDPATRFSRRTILVSPGNDGAEQIYHIHNAMADVFCQYHMDSRQPQALQFSLTRNRRSEPLYLTCQIHRMSDLSYSAYSSERSYSICLPPEHMLPLKDIKLSDEDLTQIQPLLDDAITLAMDSETDGIKKVGLILFSHDFKELLLLKEPYEEYDIPAGPRDPREHPWPVLTHIVRKLTHLHHPQQSWEGITVDIEGSFRVWIRKLTQKHDPHTIGTWVPVTKVFAQKLTHHTITLLCSLGRQNYLPRFDGFEKICPKWATTNKPPAQRTWW